MRELIAAEITPSAIGGPSRVEPRCAAPLLFALPDPDERKSRLQLFTVQTETKDGRGQGIRSFHGRRRWRANRLSLGLVDGPFVAAFHAARGCARTAVCADTRSWACQRRTARRVGKLLRRAPGELHAVAGQPSGEVITVAGEAVDGFHGVSHRPFGDVRSQQAVANGIQQLVD